MSRFKGGMVAAGGNVPPYIPEPLPRPANPEPMIPGPTGRERVRAASQEVQIFRDLRDDILSGYYPPGMKLPAMHAIADGYGVTETVAHKAATRLRSMGLLRTEPGRGTWVADTITDKARMRAVLEAVRNGETPPDMLDAGPLVTFPAAWIERLLDPTNEPVQR